MIEVKRPSLHHRLKIASWRSGRAKSWQTHTHTHTSKALVVLAFLLCFLSFCLWQAVSGERGSTTAASVAPQVNLLNHWDGVRICHVRAHTQQILWFSLHRYCTLGAWGNPSPLHKPICICEHTQKRKNLHKHTPPNTSVCTHTKLTTTQKKANGYTHRSFSWIPFLKHLPRLPFSLPFWFKLLAVYLFDWVELSKWTQLKASELLRCSGGARKDQRAARRHLLAAKWNITIHNESHAGWFEYKSTAITTAAAAAGDIYQRVAVPRLEISTFRCCWKKQKEQCKRSTSSSDLCTACWLMGLFIIIFGVLPTAWTLDQCFGAPLQGKIIAGKEGGEHHLCWLFCLSLCLSLVHAAGPDGID